MSTNPFAVTSRYYSVETVELETPDGKTIVYLKRRWVPQPERFATLQEHTVADSDRLDNLTARYIGDPEQFWRLCDANNALHPKELTETAGRVIRITLPQDIPGNSDA